MPVLGHFLLGLFLLLPLVCTAQPDPSLESLAQRFFPDADRVAEFTGEAPAAAVHAGHELRGYLFRTDDIAPIPAYSGKPVNQLVGIDPQGRIAGVAILEHHEPILLVGIPESRLDDFVDQYMDAFIGDRLKVGAGDREGYVNIDAITGATVTVMVMNEALLRAARKVGAELGILQLGTAAPRQPARVRGDLLREADWKYLTGNGSVRRLLLTRGQVDDSFAGTEAEGVDAATVDERNHTFIDLNYAYLNAPTIGHNLLGQFQYNWLMSELEEGEHAIAVMADGIYSFKGSGYVRGGIFDRLLMAQGDKEISFRDLDYHRLSDVYADGMPEFGELGIFIIRAEHAFDPGEPWRLELLVKRQTGPLDSVFSSFSAQYQLPEDLFERPQRAVLELPDEPIWKQVWRERTFQIAVLVGGLVLLTLIMGLQDILVRFPRLMVRLRIAFQLYTLFFIGWYLLGQLSIVNVFTFTGALLSTFSWDTFLIDPTMFILWTFVAGSLILWGRGVYCGWLCPYGALQKLTNELARKWRIPQLNLPQIVHDRLWGIKYLILLVLFGVSLHSLADAERYAEIEPFKTAITLRFAREWSYVFYAAAFVAISAFNCKFYCKYICPLGAALAIPARLRMVDWLRRRKECGRPCKVCEKECEIQAIDDTGRINVNECHYCLDCQITYWDAGKCPPLVEKRKRRMRAEKQAAATHVRSEQESGTVSIDVPT